MSLSRRLLIAGDAPQELFLFPQVTQSTSRTADSSQLQTVPFVGGAHLLAHLLGSLDTFSPEINLYIPDNFSDTGFNPTTLIELVQRVRNDSNSTAFALGNKRKLKNSSQWCLPKSLPLSSSTHDRSVFVVQDGSHSVGKDTALSLFQPHWPSYLVYHMAQPLCEGLLWEKIRPSPRNQKEGWDPERLIVIVQADDLRAEGIQLSYGLSWEKACEDFVQQLGSVGRLITLVTCPHLIVLFGCDGVIYHRGLEVAKPTLFFDPLRSEGDFFRENLKDVPGVMEAFIAGFVKCLVLWGEVNLEASIEAGFRTARRLARTGLSIPGPNASLYNAPMIMANHQMSDEQDALTRFDIPSDDIGRGDENSWSLLDYLVGDPAEVARKIVIEGAQYTNINVPLARFNRLALFDRKEIELFRTLFNCLNEYLAGAQTKPLNIAFFGPRGSGKSFAALQVAELASTGRKFRQLRFDLSQYGALEDLVKAFHQIRDSTLEGYMPLVYFNNFDIEFNGTPYGWLRHLLPAMAGGRFSDGGMSRPIGAAVFFFGATTTKTYMQFQRHAYGSNSSLPTSRPIREFLGCLQGFVDMVGFNRVGGADRLYPLRRAAALRSLLEEREPKLKSGNTLNIDENVLNSLLLVPEYYHGIRSLKSILAMSRLNNERHFQRAALPPRSQLELHVKYEDFVDSMRGFPLPKDIRELLAEQLHDVYIDHQRVTAHAKPEYRSMSLAQLDKKLDLTPWDQLEEGYRESNREHADAIPGKLRLINCFLSEIKEGRTRIAEFLPEEVETLAIDEKARWSSERLQRQWRTGPRDGNQRTTPFLKPWEDIEEWVKDIDRAMVRSYPKILPDNYAIYRMGSRT